MMTGRVDDPHVTVLRDHQASQRVKGSDSWSVGGQTSYFLNLWLKVIWAKTSKNSAPTLNPSEPADRSDASVKEPLSVVSVKMMRRFDINGAALQRYRIIIRRHGNRTTDLSLSADFTERVSHGKHRDSERRTASFLGGKRSEGDPGRCCGKNGSGCGKPVITVNLPVVNWWKRMFPL